jgi:two-component system, OmpR family, sensor histidine kinase CpxA
MGQLLTLSRLEAGFSSGDREDGDLTKLVEEVAADSKFEAQASGKSVSVHVPGTLILRSADAHALRSACENIIRNVVRYTHPGTNVEVKSEIDKNRLEPMGILSVRDYGPGVPEKSLDAIFQPFYRIGGDAQGLDGNGLGLAIASEANRLHGGTIRAENVRTAGLEMTIRLPLAFDPASHRNEHWQPTHSS